MPYIKQEKRDVLNPAIEQVVSALRQLESDDETNNFEGNVNYVFSSIISRSYPISYRAINDVLGVLKGVSDEYYRRVAAPYENQKAHDNGDVYDTPSVDMLLRDVK